MASNLTEPQQKSDDQRSARRRLIKGSFAAPAALTLCSGSAIAASSTTCVKTSALAGQTPGVNPAATWVRIQAFKNVEAATLKVSEWITYAQVVFTLGGSGAAVAISASNGSLGVNEALCVATEPGANGIVNEKAAWPQPGTNTPDGKHYAVLIDINGNIVGISSVSTATGGAVSNGCWQSFGGMV